jgi:polyketide synthase PksJ
MQDMKEAESRPDEKTICELFESEVQKCPSAIAAIFEDTQLSYEELNLRSTELSHFLINQGVGPGTVVGLSVDSDFHLLIGIFGILKAGGVYLPLDYGYPKERLSWMIEDAKPTLILTHTTIAHHFEKIACPIILLDRAWNHNIAVKLPNKIVSPEQPAYVVYTSGSTGRPKGISIAHRSLPHLALAHKEYYPNPIICLVTGSISFDPNILAIFHVLIAGGTLVLLGQNHMIDFDKIADLILDKSVNCFVSVPSFYAMLLEKSREFKTLWHVSLGGETIPQDLPGLHARFSPNAYLYNEYGPSEYAVGATLAKIYDPSTGKIERITIGKPLPDTEVYVLDEKMEPVAEGERGEIFIGGKGLALGYLNRPDLTSAKFIEVRGKRLYRSGDYGRILPCGNLDFLGRVDQQIKFRGYRIELGEIEGAICQHEKIKEAVVLVKDEANGNKRLIAYYSSVGNADISHELRDHLKRNLLSAMVPSELIHVERFSRTPNGKIDRAALPEPLELPVEAEEAQSGIQEALSNIWKKLLSQGSVGIHDNFFDLGGDSLGMARLQTAIQKELGTKVPIVDLFQYPTIASLAAYLGPKKQNHKAKDKALPKTESNAIAIVGMAGKFPGAKDIAQFWDNLCEGKECISTFAKDDRSNYVPARAILEDIELFDAHFFGFTAKEAEYTDPQHRLFLECAWEALENAGYSPENYSGSIGVYGGMGMSTYFLNNIHPNAALKGSVGDFLLHIGNEKDFLTTKVSYKLNLKGPSLNIQTACSTSMVAICTACDHLLSHQCDMALAGGVSITVPQETGYLYQEGMIFSSDGHCRPFDAKASGTVPGNGVGIVALKRLEDAITDKDHIYAVIRGYGVNNDGSAKVGYAAPSVQGQAEAIKAALAMSGTDPEEVSFVEAHGTGTLLGDPIEIEALKLAFGTEKKGYCSLGSLKSNMGHLIEAAGVAGLMKTALSLYHEKVPPTLHYETTNPHIDFENSPFCVNTSLKTLTSSDQLKRACVSSFGVGGTNAHVVLEQAPKRAAAEPLAEEHVLVLSAKTPTALKAMASNLAKHLESDPEISLADVAYTLRVGRRLFEHKALFSCKSLAEAIAMLSNFTPNVTEMPSQKIEGRRIPLPTYPFEKKRYWIDPPAPAEIKVKKEETQSSTTEFLLRLWKELFGLETIGMHDDFFSLGGDSLLSIQIIAKIQATYRVSLGMQALLVYPTIAKLAQAIDGKKTSLSSLVQLKAGEGEEPLFFLHPIEGNIFCYKPLADALQCKAPMYAVKAIHGREKSIEELASHYIEDIRKAQSKGPYHLIGFSFGGLLAYEIAKQLTNRGERVELLCMLDIVRPGHPSLPLDEEQATLKHLFELIEGEPVSEDALHGKRLMEKMQLGMLSAVQQQEIFETIKGHLRALASYRPSSYDGKVLFVKAKEKFFRSKELCLASTWGEHILGGIDLHEAPGSHLSMMAAPNVEHVASLLDSHLKRKGL